MKIDDIIIAKLEGLACILRDKCILLPIPNGNFCKYRYTDIWHWIKHWHTYDRESRTKILITCNMIWRQVYDTR